ncbi:DnaJ domain-containing protein [Nocardioides sp. GXQ0305]|uniref:DnaJ domain-containing protein n=1 Tax=Nocardioides sp. GXQ0305 TaxID=3423912 RepID=UPI003D7EDC8F
MRQARELFGVTASADAAQVARAYRRRARHLHPDLNGAPDATEQFWALQAAYRVALAAARRDDDPPASPQVTVGSPTVGHVPPLVRDPVTVTARPGRRGVAWLAAGPVRVQPPREPPPEAARQSHDRARHDQLNDREIPQRLPTGQRDRSRVHGEVEPADRAGDQGGDEERSPRWERCTCAPEPGPMPSTSTWSGR